MLLAVARSFYSLFLRSSYLFGSRRAFSPLSRAPSFSLLLLLLLFSTPIVPTLRVDTPEFLPMHARTHARTNFWRLKISRRSSKRFSRRRCCNAIDFFFLLVDQLLEEDVPTRAARETVDVDTSMIGRIIWRRVMQIRGSAGVDLMARAQVRVNLVDHGSLQREKLRVVGTVMGPRFSPFFGFSSNLSQALTRAEQEEIFEEACVYILFRSKKELSLISILIDRFNFVFRRLILN